ncbi:Exosomal 3'-5' exoribonuclease complex, subunit Rrp44/Dis3 [Phaffia rhodozyma]|uniref:Exosomal 3'-5' exoribonuclease complex, subunit Rrp44/Dis3 n=1 Tax=Phaffia rhodozyma TaxID=264483 RepID=A0A0F7SEX2_PHARH|nr:Exosomal 3'-5' exoribonuclease complex, subunit Rrp44/Dis3 [Phaffia rhodozyma]
MDRDTVAKMAQNCNMKKESAQLAQEQSTHLYLCLLINDLTIRYGPVIRFASVVNVLDQAFDVVIPEFGIEKRVHADQMPLENIVYEEHNSSLQLYWSERDVISYLAERDDDEHLNKVKKFGDHYAQAEIESSGKIDEEKNVPKDEAEASEESVAKDKKFSITDSIQQSKSVAQDAPVFKGLRTSSDGKHHIQEIKELMTVPVIVTADIEKSPPVIKVYAVNPYAKK